MEMARKTKQSGLSLVEMMIAMALGSVVTVGVIQLFSANAETYSLMQGQSRLQESARFSLDFMGRAIHKAGYKGCFSENEDVYTTVQFQGDIPYEYQLFRGMQAYNATLLGDWAPDASDLEYHYDAATATVALGGNAINLDNVVPGTDILTIRYASQTELPLDVAMPSSTEDVVVQMSGPLEFVEDEMVLIHDCEKSTIFRITELTDNGTLATLVHDTFDAPPINNAVQKLADVNTFEEDAAVSAIVTDTYFIAPGAGVNNVGDTPLSLWRKSGTNAPVEMIEGVEDLQVLFGVDEDSDGTPNQYKAANLVTDWTDVKTIRLQVTVNSVDEVGATSSPTHDCIADGGEQPCINGTDYDGLVRRTFSQTLQIRNNG